MSVLVVRVMFFIGNNSVSFSFVSVDEVNEAVRVNSTCNKLSNVLSVWSFEKTFSNTTQSILLLLTLSWIPARVRLL